MKHIHPFPARMAPEIALAALEGLREPGNVLDPMSGSGTVVRQASFEGHRALAFDVDPLAVLVSRVSSRKVDIDRLESLYDDLIVDASELSSKEVKLPWIDSDEETESFIRYWFGPKQRSVLRKLAYIIHQMDCAATSRDRRHIDVLKVALSRIIITKEAGASLARDVSHSRPHKVVEVSDYDVLGGFQTSFMQVLGFLEGGMPKSDGVVKSGDARRLRQIASESIDLVVTSPPYLNAIDYLRGHKLSLVWFGYSLKAIRNIRGESIGAERAPSKVPSEATNQIRLAMLKEGRLPGRFDQIASRYAADLHLIVGQIKRVLKAEGKAVLVVGDSCVQSVFISNSDGVKQSALLHGLQLESSIRRELPRTSRYLPVSGDSLSKRMRFENILTFTKA